MVKPGYLDSYLGLKTGDILIRKDGGIRVVASEGDSVFFLAKICDDGTVDEALPLFKNIVYSNLYKKLEV